MILQFNGNNYSPALKSFSPQKDLESKPRARSETMVHLKTSVPFTEWNNFFTSLGRRKD